MKRRDSLYKSAMALKVMICNSLLQSGMKDASGNPDQRSRNGRQVHENIASPLIVGARPPPTLYYYSR